MAKKPYVERIEFTETVDGEEIRASYTLDRGMVTVRWGGGPPETTQLGRMEPEALARIMLGPMVRKAKDSR